MHIGPILAQATQASRNEAGSSPERRILLTLCADGMARLWSVADSGDGGVISLFVCVTLGLDGLPPTCESDSKLYRGVASPSMPTERSLQVVQWLEVKLLPDSVQPRR